VHKPPSGGFFIWTGGGTMKVTPADGTRNEGKLIANSFIWIESPKRNNANRGQANYGIKIIHSEMV
jgi:hypothetical protein